MRGTPPALFAFFVLPVLAACAPEVGDLRSVDLIAVAERALESDDGSVAAEVGAFRAGTQSKRGLALRDAGRLELAPVRVAPGAVLHVDFTRLPDPEGDAGELSLRILGRPGASGGEEVVVFEERAGAPGAWSYAEVSVPSRLVGRSRFVFELEAADGGAVSGGAVWADAVLLPPAHATPRDAENVVLITFDTLRADHLPIYGYAKDTAPFLTELAGRTTLYELAYSASTWTLPSHASLFTGLYPSQHGAIFAEGGLGATPLASSSLTLAEVLDENGYLTMGIAGGPMVKRRFGMGQGFAYYSDEWQGYKRRGDNVNEAAFEWLDRAGERPFFLFINYFDVHGPFDPPGYDVDDSAVLEADGIDIEHFHWRHLVERDDTTLAPETVAALRARYDAGIVYADAMLRQLFERLEDRGLLENTLVCITSDHGESFGDDDTWGHGGPFHDAQAWVPLLFGRPSRGIGERAPAPVSTAAIPGWILAELGIPVTAPGLAPRERAVYGERYVPTGSNRMLVVEPHKYLVSFNQRAGAELVRWDALAGLGVRWEPALDDAPQLERARARFDAFLTDAQVAEPRAAAGRSGELESEDRGLAEQLDALGYTGEE